MSNRKKIPEIIILKVLKRQTLKCNICFKKLETTNDGVKLFDIDHIEMFSLSGTTITPIYKRYVYHVIE